jgi:hypothetical protein
MALHTFTGNNTKFINIVSDVKLTNGTEKKGAHLRPGATSDTPNAQEYVSTHPVTKVETKKWATFHSSIDGILKHVEFVDGEYGTQVVYHIEDDGTSYQVQAGVKTAYYRDLATKALANNINIGEKIKLTPFNFEDSGVKRVGVTIHCNGDKLANPFFDASTKQSLGGFPQWPDNFKNLPQSKKDRYSLDVLDFLTEKITAKFGSAKPSVIMADAPTERVTSSDVNMEDIPF